MIQLSVNSLNAVVVHERFVYVPNKATFFLTATSNSTEVLLSCSLLFIGKQKQLQMIPVISGKNTCKN